MIGLITAGDFNLVGSHGGDTERRQSGWTNPYSTKEQYGQSSQGVMAVSLERVLG